MADRHIELSLEGKSEILHALAEHGEQSLRDDVRDEIRQAIKSSLAYSEVIMRQYAPGSFKGLVGHSDPDWINANVIEGAAGVRPYPGNPKVAFYVHEGTGLYRAGDPWFIRSPRGRPMRIRKRGEGDQWVMYTRGQRPQPFVYAAYQMVQLYVKARFATMRVLGRTTARGD